ncbi:MAG: hypothetical protein Q9174_000568 [Haloplaca sp. 1 TL-2023]
MHRTSKMMDQTSQSLRLELKEWERSFAADNDGRKAGREDIKQHPDIANKYKQYNKLRAQEAEESQPEIVNLSCLESKKKRRASKPLPDCVQTPKRRAKYVCTDRTGNTVLQPLPGSSQGTPVAHRKFIGPTPQKNGRVLGLFDLLTPSSTIRTPSKKPLLVPLPSNVMGTPSRSAPKNSGERQPGSIALPDKRSKSPPSASKQAYLASFLTPSARRFADVDGTPGSGQPVSTLQFDNTPAFLRRDSQILSRSQGHSSANHKEEHDSLPWSPIAMRVMRPKSVGKGLSALVKGLRDMEEAKLDEEMDMLKELEGDGDLTARSQASHHPKVCVKDSQEIDMPLGPDGQIQSESEAEDGSKRHGTDRNGRPLKIWKKRGQKRTTRRVMMRPTNAKWKPEPEWKGAKDDDSDKEVAAVEETQFIGGDHSPKSDVEQNGLQTDDEYMSDSKHDGGAQRRSECATKDKGQGKVHTVPSEPPKGKKKKAPNSLAHANFRALKIRNKQSKGKGRGRFGLRR